MLTEDILRDLLVTGHRISDEDFISHTVENSDRTVYLMAKTLAANNKWRYLSHEELTSDMLEFFQRKGLKPEKKCNPVDFISADWTKFSDPRKIGPTKYFKREYTELFDRDGVKLYSYRIKPEWYDTTVAILSELGVLSYTEKSLEELADQTMVSGRVGKSDVPVEIEPWSAAQDHKVDENSTIQPIDLDAIAQSLVRELAFEPIDLADARLRDLRSVVIRRGQPGFRSALVDAYGGRCVVSGCDALPALEAAHIMPYKGDHTNAVNNGILLRADLHSLFDLQLIGIEPASGVLRITRELLSTSYSNLDGMRIRPPRAWAHAPNREALEWRWRIFSARLAVHENE